MSTIDNIDGIYAKDVTLREGIATLRNTVTSQTIKPLTVTQNGTYTADPTQGTYGYSPVTVDAGIAKYSSNNIMSLSYAAHINGDKVYDIATGYYIEAVKEPTSSPSPGRMQWVVYLYDNTGAFVEKYSGVNFSEEKKDDYLFAGFDINITDTTARYRIFYQLLPSYEVRIGASYVSATLKQYFSGEQGYAINADYAVIDVQPLAVSDNGTYTAPFSKAYSPVTVDVQEQPWEPLEDGYSNFWFELTDDTLSPWLNFSAKNNDAVIDWGDGSGEQALDTLTPTHTYSKAGKYVVKVKGVTGIARQYVAPYQGRYTNTLRYVELNADVSNIAAWGFYLCTYLQEIYAHNSNINIVNNAFYTCASLKNTVLPASSGVTAMANAQYQLCFSLVDVIIPTNVETIGNNVFTQCASIEKVTIPASVTSIGIGAFQYCAGLLEIHVRATVPPTLGTNAFGSLPAGYIIYVPVGTGETYKAAARWSDYADHILEEGQTPNRAMLSRLAVSDSSEEDGSNER